MLIMLNACLGWSGINHRSMVEHHDPVTDPRNLVHIVPYKDKGTPHESDFGQSAKALRVKRHISHRQNLIKQQHIRTQRGRDCKAQPHRHAGGIALDGAVDELPQFRKINDLIDAGIDFAAAQTEHRCVHIDIFPACQDGIESGTKGNERSHPATDDGFSRVGLDQAVEHSQQRGLSRAIVPDESDAFTALQLKGDIAHRPEFLWPESSI